LIKITKKIIFSLITLLIVVVSISIGQNTPIGATHLLSLSEGITAPCRIAVKSDGTIYVTDVSQNNVVKYSKSFSLIGSFNVGIKPTALAINSTDELFVGDAETGKIYILNASDIPTEFSTVVNSTYSMIFDNNDFLYVVDSKLKQITVLDTDGNFVRSIGAGLLLQPTAISYDSKNDRIFVSEHGGLGPDIGGGMMGGGYPLTQIWIFDTDGNQMGTIGEGGSEDGEFYRIQGTTISRNGTIYVTDPYQGQINIFENNGTFLNKFGEYGKLPGQLNIPMDVKFDSQGRTLVSSMNTGAIEVYYVNEINPTYQISAVKEVLCPGENTDIRIDFTGTAPWTFTYTKNGIDPITITETYDDPYIFNTTEPGLFEITVLSDANYNAVDYSNNITVAQNPYPTSEITSGDVEFCTGTNTDVAINFTGVAPYTFTYTDGISPTTIYNNELNPYIINASENGTYEVTYLRGAGGCIGTSLTGTANINVNTLPSAVIISDDIVICNGETTDIEIVFTGTAPWTFTYAINGIDQTPIITSINPYFLNTGTEGIYTITALSDASVAGTCFTGSTNVETTPLPTSNIISSDVTICEGEYTDITIELTGTAPWNVTYTINGINPVSINDIYTSPYVLSAQDSGLYEITELTGNTCSGISLVGSTELTVNPLPTSVIAEGNDQYFIYEGDIYNFSLEITGEAPWTYTYVIDGQDPTIVSTSNSTNTIIASLEGTYEVKEVSDLNCTNTKSEGFPEIVYDPSPSSFISSGDMTICEGSFANIQIDLIGTAPWSITYTKDGINPIEVTTNTSPYILSVSEPGLYKVSKLNDAILTGTRLLGEATISINPKPTSAIQSTSIAFCEGESSSIPIELTGTAPWTFTYTIDDLTPTSITTSDNSYLLDVLQSGTYRVTSISDANCTGISTTGISMVTTNPLPTVSLGDNLSICEGKSTTLDAGVFSNYLWSNGSTTQTINVIEAGIYNVNVTDNNGCKNSDEILINVNALPIVSLGTDTSICDGNSLTLDAGSFSSYSWNDGSTTQTIEVNSAGTYTLSVVDLNSCENSDEITVTLNLLPSINLGEDKSFCKGESLILDAGSFESYLWNDGSTTQTLDVDSEGNYSVDIIDTNGCSNTDEIIIIENPIPIINLGEDQAICDGETILLDAGIFDSYLWNNGRSTQIIEIDSEGTFNVNVTDTNGCSNSDEINIIVNPLPIVNLGEDQAICQGDSITLDAGSFSSYLWNNGITSQTITVNSEGIYSLTSTDENGCSNFDDISIIVKLLPDVNLGEDQTICEGETITLSAGIYSSYLWNNGSTTQDIEVNTEGTYSLTVTDINGCKNSDDIYISILPLPVSDFMYSVNQLEVSFANVSISADSYLWNFGDSITSIEINPIHTYEASGDYNITLTASSNNCGDSTIIKTINVTGTSILGNNDINKINIYPNPSTGLITIELKDYKQTVLDLEVINSAGLKVFSKLVNINNSFGHINLNELSEGIYTLKLHTKNWIKTKRFILIE
jgi:type IX secretion system substrate protein/PKD domain-containing protein